ncbi:hypothetical protein P5V30_20640 [Mycobacteroides abscessus subsp. abscessus]|uniref:hypothetical protein n=1 Tax=Mycobacteroides abscessus TaxID=36809 RepID=UPI0013F6609F|nr:hypothetical protein [Mycobacteroides abscessus]MDO2986942.1 hypothetical protein [Mycobacteroides abscessus subsp. abscessus]
MEDPKSNPEQSAVDVTEELVDWQLAKSVFETFPEHCWAHILDFDEWHDWDADTAPKSKYEQMRTAKPGDRIHLDTGMLDLLPCGLVRSDATEPGQVHAVGAEDMWDELGGAKDFGVLLRLEIVPDSATYDSADYTVLASHSPLDQFGLAGDPLRDLLDLYVNDEVDLRAASWICPYRRESGGGEFEIYQAGLAAAENALEQAERGQSFPRSCTEGDEFIALAARDLIGAVPGWTQEAYERVAKPYAEVTGRRLHPDDPDFRQEGEGKQGD